MKFFVSLAFVVTALATAMSSHAQTQRSVVIGEMTNRPNAIVVMNPANNDQGFLLPQLTTSERNGMKPTSPDEDGLLVFDITEKSFYYWKDGAWTKSFGGTSTSQTLSYDPVTRKLSISSGNTVDIAPQTLSWDAATRKIFISNGNSIDISSVGNVSAPVVQFYSIDPADFTGLRTATKKDHDNTMVFEDNTTFATVVKRDEGTSFIAPIHLPDGAVIQQVQVFYMDRDNQNLSVNVLRKSFAGSNDAIVNTWTSTGNTSTIQTASILPITTKATIDNGAYSYRIVIQLNPNTDTNNSSDASQRIYGVRIQYLK